MAGTKRTAAAWRAVFLDALARGRSASAAAVEAKVHYQTAFNARKRDEAFAAEWASALARGQARLAGARAPKLRADEVVSRSKTGVCVMKAGADRWSAGKERRFLDALGATANVRAAAAAAGVSCTAVYRRRRVEAAFAERWQASLEQGWARVEAALVHAAASTLEGLPPAEEDGAVPARLTVAEAIGVYRERQRALAGLRDKRPGPRPADPTPEQVHDELLRRIEAMGG